jgi:hypothetical protein
MAFVLCGNLGEEPTASCGLESARPVNKLVWHVAPARNRFSLRSVDGLGRRYGRPFLKRPASWRGTGLRVAPTGEEFVDCDHRGAGDDGDGRHHENSFDHGFPLADLNVKTPEESCSRKTRELRGRAISRGWVANTRPATSVISLAQ